MAKYNIVPIDDKAFNVIELDNGYTQRYNTICSVRGFGNSLSIQNRFSGAFAVESEHYTDVQVNGASYPSMQETCDALDEIVNISFNNANGGGSTVGAETDPVAMAALATYFDANGQLRTSAMPAGTGVPVELLSSAPVPAELNTMYVFPNTDGIYQMQFWDGNSWNIVGDFAADFNIANYPTTDDMNAALANFVDNTTLNTILANYATSSQLASKQAATTAAMAGKVLTGGQTAGTFGTLSIDTAVTEGSANLITSDAVFEALSAGGGGTDTETDPVAVPVLTKHIATDQGRWDDFYQFKLSMIDLQEQVKGLKPDSANNVLVTVPPAMYTYQFPKAGTYAIAVEFTNQNGNFTNIMLSTEGSIYQSDGLADNIPFTWSTSVDVGINITLTVTNARLIEILPYVSDPDSPMLLELDHQTRNTAYQSQVLTPIDVKTGQWLVTGTEFNYDVTKLSNHISTDINRWKNVYQFQGEIIDSVINAKGMKRDTANNIQFTTSLTAVNALGGLLTVIVNNSTSVPTGIVTINNVRVYDSTGLQNGVPVTLYFPIKANDVITVSGVQSAIFTPYIADPASSQQQMLASINLLVQRVGDLQSQINDAQATISNKTVANVTPIDITNTSYTVNNALGARITGQGSQVLGLLGITVASTGTVSVNGTQVYNNTALLSGTPEILSINVDNGAVISSSGMSYVDVYLYVAG